VDQEMVLMDHILIKTFIFDLLYELII